MVKKKNKKINQLKLLFLIIIFLFTILLISVFTGFRLIMQGFPIIAIIITILGIILIILTHKARIKKKQKQFLILTGIGVVGFSIFSILHNLFYALGVLFENILMLQKIMEIFHVLFFLISILICPIIFLIGTIGTIILFIKK